MKQLFFIAAYFIFLFSQLHAQKLFPQRSNSNNLYGYTDQKGSLKIDYQFDDASFFDKKTKAAIVQKGEKFFLINKDGIKISKDYEQSSHWYLPYLEDVINFPLFLQRNNRWYPVNTDGEELNDSFSDILEDNFLMFRDGSLAATVVNDGGNIGLYLFDEQNLLADTYFDSLLITPFNRPQPVEEQFFSLMFEDDVKLLVQKGGNFHTLDIKDGLSAAFQIDNRFPAYPGELELFSQIIVRKDNKLHIMKVKEGSLSPGFNNIFQSANTMGLLAEDYGYIKVSGTENNLSGIYDIYKREFISHPFYDQMSIDDQWASGIFFPFVRKGYGHLYVDDFPTDFDPKAYFIEICYGALAHLQETYYFRETKKGLELVCYERGGEALTVDDYRFIHCADGITYMQINVDEKKYSFKETDINQFFEHLIYAEDMARDEREGSQVHIPDYLQVPVPKVLPKNDPVILQYHGKYELVPRDSINTSVSLQYFQMREINKKRYLVANENGYQGIINEKGKIILPLKYQFIVDAKGKYIVHSDSGYEFLVDNGNDIINPSGMSFDDFDYASVIQEDENFFQYDDGLELLVLKDGKYGKINNDFELVIKPDRFIYLENVNNNPNSIALTAHDGWALCDSTGKIITKQFMQGIMPLGGVFRWENNHRYGLLSKNGEMLTENIYNYKSFELDEANRTIILKSDNFGDRSFYFDEDWNIIEKN